MPPTQYATQYTEQQAWNVLAGNSPTTLYSGQQVVNAAVANSPTTLVSEQQAVNQAVSQVSTYSEQATIHSNLTALLGLNSNPMQYTVQFMLNLAINAGLSLSQVLGLGGGGGGSNVGLNMFLTLLGP